MHKHLQVYSFIPQFILICFVFPVFGFGQSGASQDSSEKNLDFAHGLKDQKKCDEALPLFKKVYRDLEGSSQYQKLTECADSWAECLLNTGKMDSALLMYNKTIEHGKKAKDYERVMYAYSVHGAVYQIRGFHNKSLKNNLQCAKYCKLIENDSVYSSRLSIIGSNYFALGKYDSAYYYVREAVRIKEQIQDTIRLAVAYDYLGAFYQDSRELGKAAEAFLKALEWAEIAQNDYFTSNALYRLSMVMVADGHYEKARPYAERAVRLNDSLGLPMSRALALNVLADIEETTGNQTQAENYLQEALAQLLSKSANPKVAGQYLRLARHYYSGNRLQDAERYASLGMDIAREIEDKTLLSDHHNILGKIKLKTGSLKQADQYLKEALKASRTMDRLPLQVDVLNSLAELEYQRARPSLAYQYLKEAIQWQDTLQKRQQSEYVQKLEAQYKRGEQDARIDQLELEKKLVDVELKTSQSRQGLLILAGLLALLAAFLGFYLFNQQKRNQQILLEKNETIQKTLEEKEMLLREIHHRVKNNLQVVSSLLSLQSKYITDPKAISAVTNSRTRVRSMALIHQNLYQTDNLMSVNVRAYFVKLLDELFSTYSIDQEKIELQTDIDDLKIDVDSIIPIGLIINELVSNSLKHAFKDGERGRLEVVLRKQTEGLLLEVSDTGKGFKESNLETSNSFGFKLIRAFATKLEADIDLVQKGEMHTVRLQIPNSQFKTSP